MKLEELKIQANDFNRSNATRFELVSRNVWGGSWLYNKELIVLPSFYNYRVLDRYSRNLGVRLFSAVKGAV
jgi:hypothetical protein